MVTSGIGFVRLVTQSGTVDFECRILEAPGAETIIAVPGNIDVDEARSFTVDGEQVTAVRVSSATVVTRQPAGWTLVQWRPPAHLVRHYYREVEQDGISLSASEAVPVAEALAPSPMPGDRIQQLEQSVQLLQSQQSAAPAAVEPRSAVLFHSIGSPGTATPQQRRGFPAMSSIRQSSAVHHAKVQPSNRPLLPPH